MLHEWTGKSFFLLEQWTPAPHLQLQTDASGSVGYGAYWAGRWFRGSWTTEQQEQHITFKELYAIVVACANLGQ